MPTGTYYLTINMMQSFVKCVMPLVYTTPLPDTDPQAEFVAATLWDAMTINVMPRLSTQIQMYSIEYLGTYGTGSGVFADDPVFGSMAGDVLPAFLTCGFTKQVESAVTQSGLGLPIKRGFLRLSGIPESVQNNRIIYDSAWKSDILAGLNSVRSLDIPGEDNPLTMHVVRLEAGGIDFPPNRAAEVVFINNPKIGTQNTRKE